VDERVHNRSFVDVHAHVLAGIDDGPVDDGETDALLDTLAGQGVTTVVATPHVDARFPPQADEVAGRVRALRDRRSARPNVLAGAEVHPGRLDEVIAAGPERFTLGGAGTLLVEAAPDVPPTLLEHCVRRLDGVGVRCLFAHAERSRALGADDGLARDLVARGARLQVNANSIRSGSGDRGRLAWHLLELGLVSIVASDSHALGLRPPRLAEAADELARRLDEDAVHTLTYANPTALCDGHDAPPFQPTSTARRRTWLRRAGRQ
jgi:protein-tyrosine phosphatase